MKFHSRAGKWIKLKLEAKLKRGVLASEPLWVGEVVMASCLRTPSARLLPDMSLPRIVGTIGAAIGNECINKHCDVRWRLERSRGQLVVMAMLSAYTKPPCQQVRKPTTTAQNTTFETGARQRSSRHVPSRSSGRRRHTYVKSSLQAQGTRASSRGKPRSAHGNGES